jgi:hypothetical protein
MGTYSMETPPSKSGRYLVHHRGHAVVMHYLHPDGEWMPGTKTGWLGDLGFLPTHWSDLPETPEEPGFASARARAARLIDVYGQRPDYMRPRQPPREPVRQRSLFWSLMERLKQCAMYA